VADALRAPLYSQTRESVGEIELPAGVFDAPVRSHLLYETVKMQLANRRAGTHATKTRAFVSGGGKKPWKQKGTGRARQGSTRATQWVGGATVFGPQPRDYSYHLPASSRLQAIRSALSAKMRERKLLVVQRLELPSGKTKEFAKMVAALGVESALILVGQRDDMLHRAARNLPRIKMLDAAGVNVYDVLNHEHLIVTADAVEVLKERLST
jgi:large subunit ribosomal protein L4